MTSIHQDITKAETPTIGRGRCGNLDVLSESFLVYQSTPQLAWCRAAGELSLEGKRCKSAVTTTNLTWKVAGSLLDNK